MIGLVFFSLIRGQGGKRQESAAAHRLWLALLFLLGAGIGYLYACSCADSSALQLQRYLDGYCALFAEGGEISPLAAVKLYILPLFLLFLGGFWTIGVIMIPLVTMAYGFSAMFAVACFVCLYGRKGLALALAALGLRLLFTLPCILWIGADRWACSMARIGKGKRKRTVPKDNGTAGLRFLVCAVMLLIGVAIECSVTPAAFRWALSGL